MRQLFPLLLAALVLFAGCDEPVAKKKPKAKPAPQASNAVEPKKKTPAAEPPRKKRRLPGAWEDEPNIKAASLPQSDPNRIGGRNFNFSAQADQSQHVFDELRESIKFGPTLVVWLVDSTGASATLRGQVANSVRTFYSSAKPADEAADRLLSVVVPYADRAPTELPEPTATAGDVALAFDKLPQASGTSAATFATMKAAADAYLPFRTQKQREVMFVLITAQRGSDWQQADAPIAVLRKNVIPVYVVGWPAPLGKEQLDNKSQVDLGPESRYKEAIEIESLAGGYDLEFMDSGFGPFPLEWVARATEGKFVALRPSYQQGGFSGPFNASWPSSDAHQFDPQTMKKYAPDYVSEADYQALLKANAACGAVHNAAKLPRVEVRTQLATRFTKRNEAQFVKDVSKAQQGAARLEPDIERLYEALAGGEGDRAKLTSPRWQAEYDVAMGRACAAKARIDGYNMMLAGLKSGKNFAQPTSNTWILTPADSTDAGSAILKLVERSQMYLKRVVADHPGTPWARIAEHELQTQVGWKWTEE